VADYGEFTEHSWVAADLTTGDSFGSHGESLYMPRMLFDSGRLFFNSADALVPEDIDHAEDVYEYEPVGSSSVTDKCSSDSGYYVVDAKGCISLISSGTAASGAGFLDASASGDDVFFITGGQLGKGDSDLALDVYDAHVCGSSWNCINEEILPPVCSSSDACRGAASPQPSIFGPPPSATFQGGGNVVTSQPKPILKVKKKTATRKQRLIKALQKCKKLKHRRRLKCERMARDRYGQAKKQNKSMKRPKRGA
jgi:hypothetical protein